MGDGYGLSIRGGIEHGLGVYVSFVEPGSMAAINGVKVSGGQGRPEAGEVTIGVPP